MNNQTTIRVRFAPSPTGELHVGGARTALYNYLFARAQDGQFIIRLEDTDQERYVPGSLDRLLSGLKWLGISWDEGPDKGGPYAPYIQSARLDLYKKYALQLINTQAAYYCFCSTERLTELRLKQQTSNEPSRYDRCCLNLTAEQIQTKLSAGENYTIRLLVPPGKTEFSDLIRGTIIIDNQTIDDQVLLKSDGYPTYHLANVVDDYLMQITHVIRGEEWLPSASKHILLYRALGWAAPEFAHLPNVLNKNRAKLSKRKDGAAVWVETYKEQGYLPEALVNFLALLGWHPTGDQELFTLDELIKQFSLTRVQKAGAIFDIDKLLWFNNAYIKKLPPAELDELLQPFYRQLTATLGRPAKNTLNLTTVLQTRLTTLGEVSSLATWFFKKDLNLTAGVLTPAQSHNDKTKLALRQTMEIIPTITDWNIANLQTVVTAVKEQSGLSNQEFLWPVRMALSGEKQSPDVYSLLWALGADESISRLQTARAVLAE
ncbi:MAG: glutamate--tRNA ligase [Candidatus Kerfeldbacteria bacterium]|nr:glutamate--tRNA ligase [Candidatus Kerfeldbacteria bacterium]